ncbi:MAG: hypothetical protein M0024_01480 [Nitrospiraceae bacterium]|nr:hypothetical protein [Nitrospiraceae bacterium]
MSWKIDFTRELSAAHNGSRAQILERYERMTGHSRQHLYRIAKEHGWTSGKKSRADKGERTSGITKEQITYVAGLMSESARENKGVIMPVERALEIAMDPRNGIIEPGSISVARMQEILREQQLNKAALDADTPYTPMRSLHPNHVHQIDASVCIQYYLRNGKTALIDERDFNDKKPQNMAKIKTRLARYILTDHFSGAFYLKYYLADGESSATLYDFITSAWAHKQNDQYPFRGVPFLILWDAASAAKAKAMQSFISGLGISLPPGMPHNPRRQGSVETTQQIVERWFESGLRFNPAFSVEQLNEWAIDWTIKHNATKEHSRHGMPRTTCWMLITQEQLRELPSVEILQDLYANPEKECTVYGDYSISFRGEKYEVKHIPGLYRGAKVQAILKPFEWPAIEVLHAEKVYACQPITVLPAIQGGFRADAAIIGQTFKSQPETMTQQGQKEIENYAYGETRTKESIPFAGVQVMGGQADQLGNVSFMPKRGTVIEVDRSIADAEIPIAELFKRILQNGVQMTKDLNQQLRTEYGGSISKSKAEEVIAQLQAGVWQAGGSAGEGEGQQAAAV